MSSTEFWVGGGGGANFWDDTVVQRLINFTCVVNESCFWWFWFKQPHCQRFQLVFYTLGPLQIQFLSGATRHPICQHFQLYQEISEYSLLPCLCDSDEAQQDDELHIMWLTMDTDDTTESHILNHIISLVPNRGI